MLVARPENPVDKVCTLGFNARWGNHEVFLTASHCTPTRWSTDQNSAMFQHVALPDSVEFVGLEYADPPGYSCGFLWLKKCRKSDAAIFLIGPYVLLNQHVNRGFIARTVGQHTGPTIDPFNPRFQITARSNTQYPAAGTQVQMMGQFSGWTVGVIDDNCADFNVPDSGKRLICQATATYASEDGDSGAPVFELLGGSHVRLHGIHVGRTSDNQFAIFSKLWGITEDLGTLSVYAPGWGTPPPPPPGGDCDGGDIEDPIPC